MKIFDKLIFKNINKAMNIIHFFEWEQPDIISFDFDDTLCLKYGVPNEEIVKIVWHPQRMSKWPEDYLIYDPDDDSMDYASTNCKIRDIITKIKSRT